MKFVASKLARNERIFDTNVIIKGGHGLTGTGLVLADNLVMRDYAVITALSDADFNLIKDNFAFKNHLKSGVFVMVESDSEGAAYAALRDMTDRTENSVQMSSGELDSIADEQSDSTGVAIVLSEGDEMKTSGQIEDALVAKTKRLNNKAA